MGSPEFLMQRLPGLPEGLFCWFTVTVFETESPTECAIP